MEPTKMVVGGSRPTFGDEGWQKMIKVLVAQGGGRSPSNVSRRGLAEFARAAMCAGGLQQGRLTFAVRGCAV